MAHWILVVHNEAPVVEGIKRAMQRLDKDAEPLSASNIEDAKRLLQQKGADGCRLIVAGIRVPRSPSDSLSLDGTELTTLDLLRWAREPKRNPKLPAVLLAAFTDSNRASALVGIEDIEVVSMHQNFDLAQSLVDAGRRLVQRRKAPGGLVDIDIELQRSVYRWKALGVQPPLEAAGPLGVKREDIDRLKDLCSQKPENLKFLSAVGRDLYDKVFSANVDEKCTPLKELLDKYCGDNDSLRRTRIRFIVDDHTHPILLESVAKLQRRQPSFWMLEAPIFRRYDLPAARAPLFKDRASRNRPLNCLLIQGDVTGFNADPPLSKPLPAIGAARDEVLEIEEFLLDNMRAFRVGKVQLIQHPGGAAATPRFLNALKATLAERTWDLVHYSGHSSGEATKSGGSRGYLVFGPGKQGIVEARTFARWVKKSQFLFLSSCQSAGAHFVLQLVKQTVPAIIGYRWEINDTHAKVFAKSFYSSLFAGQPKNRYLEYAFLEAKKALHQSESMTPVWAAPMLVMQTVRAEPD